jgi:pyruvate,water dikinase
MALRFLLERVDPIEADRMAQSLTSGIRDLESARPAIALQRIATLAQGEPDAKAALLDENTTGMDAIPEGQTKRAIASFLDLYGDRAVREAELSTPRWNEDSRTVLTMIRVALRGERADMERILIRGQRQADEDWARLFPRLGFVEQIAVRHLIARAQKAARLREVMRAWVTRVLGMLRHAFLDADRRLMRREPDLNADQRVLVESKSPIAGIGPSFFLTIDEVVHALRTGRSDLTPIVRARRAEYLRDLARPDPPSTFVGTPPPLVLLPTGGDVVRGLPAGPGVVEGPARVLRGIHEAGLLEAGEILVVRTTDVGWTPLFPMAAGVVTELGGPLSHAAIVAREFGIPTVVNAEGATRVFRTGDRLRLDGDRGVVERLLR